MFLYKIVPFALKEKTMIELKESKPDRRRFPRVKAQVYYRPASILKARHRISNISLGGVRIYSDERLKKGKRLEIELFLPSGHSIEAIARVVWIKELPPDSKARFDVGLEFISLPPNAMQELKLILEDISSHK